MLSAYQDTIDHDGESLDDARREVQGYFRGHPLLEHSVVIAGDPNDVLLSACLVAYLTDEEAPLIAYVMTRRASKMHGLARTILNDVLARLENAGHDVVLATITEGNTPSERLFGSIGFERLD
jgi:L-amino acid N-acyltransferase YncA